MYNSINYLLSLFIIFLLLKIIKTESVNVEKHFNYTGLQQWQYEGHYSTSMISLDNDLQTSSSYEFCIPFYSCSTNTNRTILIILIPIFILMCCCYYHCFEYCRVKHELDEERNRKLPQSRCIGPSVHHKCLPV